MAVCNRKGLAFALLLAALPTGFVFAAGGGRGGGVGAVGAGSAAIGGGPSGGRVGGGPPAGAVGGGLPGRFDPGGNGAAGTGNPALNTLGAGSSGNKTNAPGVGNTTTKGSAFGGEGGATTGAAPSRAATGGAAPSSNAGSSPNASNNKEGAAADSRVSPIQGLGDSGPFSPTGLSQQGPDGVSTVIVAARPCGVAARETDGTTTCIGIPKKRNR
jgi:hypothetical protein